MIAFLLSFYSRVRRVDLSSPHCRRRSRGTRTIDLVSPGAGSLGPLRVSRIALRWAACQGLSMSFDCSLAATLPK